MEECGNQLLHPFIYRKQIKGLLSWIWIKDYMENFRKELCSLEVWFV